MKALEFLELPRLYLGFHSLNLLKLKYLLLKNIHGRKSKDDGFLETKAQSGI